MSGSRLLPSPAIRGSPRRVDDRRNDVEGAREIGHLVRARLARGADDQRHVEQLVVERLAVAELAVVPELLAVVGGHDDERAVEEPAAREAAQEAADLPIGPRELGVVEIPHTLLVGVVVVVLPGRGGVLEGETDPGGRATIDEQAGVAGRWTIRHAGVAVVQVERGRASPGGAQPSQAGRGDRARVEVAGDDGAERRLLGGEPEREVAIVHDRARAGEAAVADPRREAGQRAVRHERRAGQHLRRRRQRARSRRERGAEARRVGGERIEVRRRRPAVAHAAQMIGANRVEDDQEHARSRAVAGGEIRRRPERERAGRGGRVGERRLEAQRRMLAGPRAEIAAELEPAAIGGPARDVDDALVERRRRSAGVEENAKADGARAVRDVRRPDVVRHGDRGDQARRRRNLHRHREGARRVGENGLMERGRVGRERLDADRPRGRDRQGRRDRAARVRDRGRQREGERPARRAQRPTNPRKSSRLAKRMNMLRRFS